MIRITWSSMFGSRSQEFGSGSGSVIIWYAHARAHRQPVLPPPFVLITHTGWGVFHSFIHAHTHSTAEKPPKTVERHSRSYYIHQLYVSNSTLKEEGTGSKYGVLQKSFLSHYGGGQLMGPRPTCQSSFTISAIH